MSSNNYSSGPRNENQGYTFNGIPPFFPQCTTEDQLSSTYPANTIINVGLSGPGTHLEETASAVPAVIKTSGRGRRKNRKKISRIEDLGDPLQIDPVGDVVAALNDDIPIPRIQNENQGDPLYTANPDLILSHDNQIILNSNTLDQILSYKKMLLLQSPEVVEFLTANQPKHHQPNNKKRGQQ